MIPALFTLKYTVSTHINIHLANGLPGWWAALDYLFLVVSFIAVYHAATHAAAKGVKRFLWLFWACLAVAIFFEKDLHWMAYVASVGLVSTHITNIRQHRKKTAAIS